jgi:hypothetical protein
LEAGPVSARDFFTLLWPYRKRADGPEKDLSFEQLRAALATNPSRLVLRQVLESTSGLSTLIRCRLPGKAAAELEAFARDRSPGYALRKNGNIPASGFFTALLDLPSWIDLYREGILPADSPDYRYESLEREIIEILLESTGS